MQNDVMRRIISIAIAACLALGGTAAAVYLLLFAAGWRGWMVLAAALVATVGAVWLWADLFDKEAPAD